MADIRRLTTTRGAHRGQMTKLLKKLEETKSNFDGVPSQTQTQTFRVLYESVLTNLDDLKKLDDTILEATETDELAEAIYINYLQIQIGTISVDITNTDNSGRDTSTHGNVTKHTVNLPKLQLPKFDGNFLKWIGFNDAFTSAVDNDSNLEDIQKFQYLIAQLTGDASKAIEGLQLTSVNYREALELLRKRYGQTHKLISSYMKALWELPKPSNSLESVREFYDNLETYVRGLKSLGESEDSYGDLLVPIVFEKLPGQIRTHISREHGDSAWTLTELKDSLYKEIQAAQAGDNNYLGSTTDVSNTSAFSITTKPTYRKFCAFCGGAHFHKDCVVVSDKRKCMDIVKRAHLCFNCLKGKHSSLECLARGRCHICQRKHHTSLCNANTQTGRRPAETKGLDQPQPNQETRTHVTLTPTSGPVLLKTAVGTIESRVGPATNINILFDEGAQRSFITSTAAKRLGIDSDNCETENVQLATFGTNSHGVQSVHITPLKLITREGRVDIRALIVPKISAPMKNYMESTVKSYPYLQNLTLARPVHADVFEIDLLLGADYYWSIVGNDVIRGPGPTAVSSKLGFLLSGPTNLKTDVSVYQTICLKVATDMIDTHHDISKLSRYWDLETIGITDDDNIPHTKSFEKFRDENIRMVGGKYSAKLPWRENHPPLPTNNSVCYARTRTMIRNLSPQLLDTYNTIITEQLSRGFIERVLDDDATHGHYIPHHCVKKDSTTTPIRIVYDCSCRQSDNPSLNQCLETGPPLLNDMVGILLRFRVNEVAFTADIEKAFLNVQLDQHDRDYTKFLWLSNPDDPESAFNTCRFVWSYLLTVHSKCCCQNSSGIEPRRCIS